ncbi:MAG: Phosphate acetyltransferase [Candidatus Woesearchaeota archaeon]|nr:Phosphate acetyltransferase [Candidatus Woesearchaeota archaeon]
MKEFMNNIFKKASSDPKRIVFCEGEDPRVVKALKKITDKKIAKPIVVGKISEQIDGVQLVDLDNFNKIKEYAEKLVEIRKHKDMTLEKANKLLQDPCYLGTMMVYMQDADGLVAGCTHSTAKTVIPALQIIKTHDKFHKVSGLFLMMYDSRILLFADCAITINPDAKDLADIAIDSANTAEKFGIEPKVAMLSFSTKGSAKHPMVDKIREATKIVKSKKPELIIDGEMQVDAAIVPKVANIKCPDCVIQGDANVLVFPDLNSGNMAYKLVERLGKFKAVGPILQGLKKPVNDLSRGCSAQDIVDVTAITVVEAQ